MMLRRPTIPAIPAISESKQPNPTQREPIVLLDVYGTLIVTRKNEQGAFVIDTFNDALVNALVYMNIKEVYLLTPFGLRLPRTPALREQVSQILLTQLVDHLKKNGVAVKAIMSKYDLSPERSLGSYYTEVIELQEKSVLENPKIDLTYCEQQENLGSDHEKIKSRLASLFFKSLELSENPRTVLFFDDSFKCLDAVSAIAKEHKMSFDTCKVKKEFNRKHYVDFLSKHKKQLPDLPVYQRVYFQKIIQLVEMAQGILTKEEIENFSLTAYDSGNSQAFEDAILKAITGLEDGQLAIIRDYLLLSPTQKMVADVNQDLNNLRNMRANWVDVPVTLTPDHVGREYDLQGLQLDGIVFSKEEKNHVDEAKTVSAEEATNEYCRWQQSHSSYRGKVKFSKTGLEGAKFENIYCAPFDFSDAISPYASLTMSRLTWGVFDRANLRYANLSFCFGGGDLTGQGQPCTFDSTNLTHASLYKSNFKKHHFENTIFDDANLSEGEFDHANFIFCSMPRVNLTMASFVGARFGWNIWNRSDLTGSDATKSDFTNADFSDVILEGVIFKDATLTGAKFKDANLKNAVLSGANYSLDQFTKEQLLSLRYIGENDKAYVSAICDYMAENEESKHPKGFERARRLLKSFIDGDPYENNTNKLLAGFLLTGNLPGEGSCARLFSSSETNPNSLRGRLRTVRDVIALQAPSQQAAAWGLG